MKKNFVLFILLILGLSTNSSANDIVVSRATIRNQNRTLKFSEIQFDLAWKNSWRWNSVNNGISFLGIKSGGSGYTSAPTVSISSGTVSATATATVSGGQVTGLTLTNPGQGFTLVPAVTFSGGGGTTPASADAHITSWWDAAWVFAKFRVGASNPVFSGINLAAGATTITLPSGNTSNLRVGMPVQITGGTGSFDYTFTGVTSAANQYANSLSISSGGTALYPGMRIQVTSGPGYLGGGNMVRQFGSNTTIFLADTVDVALSNSTVTCYGYPRITSIVNSTQFTISNGPSVALSNATIECIRIWEHARLNNTGHTAPAGSQIDAGLLSPAVAYNATSNPALGVFIYKSSSGAGDNAFNGVRLRWNYGNNGLSDDAIVDIQVFATEMVYVPGGVDFAAGTPNSYASPITLTTINTADARIAPSGTGSMGGQAGGRPSTGVSSPVFPSFPNGYNAFYCMKYELTQGQYRDFLNTLLRSQQVRLLDCNFVVGQYAGGAMRDFCPNVFWRCNGKTDLTNPYYRVGLRVVQDPGGLRPLVFACDLNQSLSLPSGVNQTDDGEWIAMPFLFATDGLAFADWAALRPMTQLEYHKASRGNQRPFETAATTGEAAWGTCDFVNATSFLDLGTSNELSNTANSNYFSNTTNMHGSNQGPRRVGMFATATSNRVQSGASFYGILDLQGNLREYVFTTAGIPGQHFNGGHGDGNLSPFSGVNTIGWTQGTTANSLGELDWSNEAMAHLGNYYIIGSTCDVTPFSLVSIINSNPQRRENTMGWRLGRTF